MNTSYLIETTQTIPASIFSPLMYQVYTFNQKLRKLSHSRGTRERINNKFFEVEKH